MPTPVQEDLGKLIKSVPLLALLKDDDIRALAARGRNRSFSAGEIIFREGDEGDALHVVVRGSVRISRMAGSGDEATVAIMGPGECFGEQAFLDRLPRSATATSIREARTFSVSRTAFHEWLREHPEASLALLETLSLRLRRTSENVADLMFMDLGHRLAKNLLSLAPDSPKGARLSITQAELGAMLGVSRESVNKQLNVFARQGLIKLGRGNVTILDAEGLRSLEG